MNGNGVFTETISFQTMSAIHSSTLMKCSDQLEFYLN